MSNDQPEEVPQFKQTLASWEFHFWLQVSNTHVQEVDVCSMVFSIGFLDIHFQVLACHAFAWCLVIGQVNHWYSHSSIHFWYVVSKFWYCMFFPVSIYPWFGANRNEQDLELFSSLSMCLSCSEIASHPRMCTLSRFSLWKLLILCSQELIQHLSPRIWIISTSGPLTLRL